jgi:hypothetical protein
LDEAFIHAAEFAANATLPSSRVQNNRSPLSGCVVTI